MICSRRRISWTNEHRSEAHQQILHHRITLEPIYLTLILSPHDDAEVHRKREHNVHAIECAHRDREVMGDPIVAGGERQDVVMYGYQPHVSSLETEHMQTLPSVAAGNSCTGSNRR
jgi:hypothetical protein